MAATVFQIVQRNIDEQLTLLTRALTDGSAKDYAEYRAMCGEIRGLSLAHNFITDLVRKMERDEDE